VTALTICVGADMPSAVAKRRPGFVPRSRSRLPTPRNTAAAEWSDIRSETSEPRVLTCAAAHPSADLLERPNEIARRVIAPQRVVLGAAGIAEAAATDGVGILATLLALEEGSELVGLGGLIVVGGILIGDESVGRAIRCGVP